MTVVHATAVVAAAPERVWEVIGDPGHLPRWWPGVSRIEDVQADRWTQVLNTTKGRPVRADFRLLESEPPGTPGQALGTGGRPPGRPRQALGRRRWEQEIEGTPFERVLTESITEVSVQAAGSGTRVTIEQRQKLRGYARAGSFMLRRATDIKLAQALDALAGVCGYD
ncbi:MAG: SRPBCC family protein [Solirubrobacteraceae bacterium]